MVVGMQFRDRRLLQKPTLETMTTLLNTKGHPERLYTKGTVIRVHNRMSQGGNPHALHITPTPSLDPASSGFPPPPPSMPLHRS